MPAVVPIFATRYDTEKPIRITLDRALQGDETLRIYIFDDSQTRIAVTGSDYVWAELARSGSAPNWPVLAAGSVQELFIDCDQLYTNTGRFGTYFLQATIWDADNDYEEAAGSQVLVLQEHLYPGQ